MTDSSDIVPVEQTLRGVSGLILGAAAAIEQTLAQHLTTPDGQIVIASHLRSAPLGETVQQIVVDLRDPEALAPLLQQVGEVDWLVCLASGYTPQTMIPAGQQTWRTVVELPLSTAVAAAQAVLPGMVERGFGRVVIIGMDSGAGSQRGGQAAFRTSMAGAVQALSRESAGDVTVNAVLAPPIDGPHNRQLRPRADRTKWMNATDLAAVVAFLLSPESRAIQGVAIPLNGS